MYNLAAVGYVLVLTLLQGSQANTVGINVTVSGVQQRSSDILASLANLESSAVRTAQSPGPGSYVSPGLLSAFPEDIEISDQCQELLQIFSQQCSSFVDCILTSARPVRVCQNCFSRFNRVQEIFTNISSETSFGNVSCRDSLLRSDRLQLVFVMYQNLKRIWESSLCEHCLTPHMGGLSNDSLYFMALLNKSLSCFEKYQQSNRSELCKECKTPYKSLNNLYNSMVKNSTLCIDIEDAMNMTRRLWSKNFNCSFPREETVPIIAVSSFMLFLPIIFYLSSFLHSEQKKRKLILPKRAKSSNSLMNIQDKCS